MVARFAHLGESLLKYKGFFYGLGTLGRSSVGFVASSWLLYFYMPPERAPLVPIALYGIAIFGGRLVSALITPYIGYFSEISRNRFGRRLPLMFVAVIFFLVAFALLWRPPLQNESLLNWVFLFSLVIIFRLSTSLHQVPSQALLPELAEDVSDMIGIISPYETPVLNALGDPLREAKARTTSGWKMSCYPTKMRSTTPPGVTRAATRTSMSSMAADSE